MSLKLSNAEGAYSPRGTQERNRALEAADRRNVKIGDDVDGSVNRIILTSPDGNRWLLTVDNTGTLGTTAL